LESGECGVCGCREFTAIPESERACRRADGSAKRAYSKQEAKAVAKRAGMQGVYRCPLCDRWHVARDRGRGAA
jgi:hypothetical protein